jgi:hypothetical protein
MPTGRVVRSRPVFERVFSRHFCTVVATENAAVRFEAVPHDAYITVRAMRCEQVNGTLETIEGMGGAAHGYLKGLVVVVATNFACLHGRAGLMLRNSLEHVPPQILNDLRMVAM